jgi:hypothetical protein
MVERLFDGPRCDPAAAIRLNDGVLNQPPHGDVDRVHGGLRRLLQEFTDAASSPAGHVADDNGGRDFSGSCKASNGLLAASENARDLFNKEQRVIVRIIEAKELTGLGGRAFDG